MSDEISPNRPMDAKTAYEFVKIIGNYGVKLEEMEKRQNIVLQEIKSEQRASHFEMLTAVDASVEKSNRYMQAILSGFKQELKNCTDDHERRITIQEQKEMTYNDRLSSIENHTEDIPGIKDLLKEIDERTISFPDVKIAVESLVAAPGNKAIAILKRVLVVAGFLGLAVFTWWLGTTTMPISKHVITPSAMNEFKDLKAD